MYVRQVRTIINITADDICKNIFLRQTLIIIFRGTSEQKNGKEKEGCKEEGRSKAKASCKEEGFEEEKSVVSLCFQKKHPRKDVFS